MEGDGVCTAIRAAPTRSEAGLVQAIFAVAPDRLVGPNRSATNIAECQRTLDVAHSTVTVIGHVISSEHGQPTDDTAGKQSAHH